MIGIGIITAVFVMMLSAPFAAAMIYCAAKTGKALSIEQKKVRDARYFGKSFARLVEKNLAEAKDGRICLSKKEYYVDGDAWVPGQESVEALVICRECDYEAPEKIRTYRKEIYAAHSLNICRKNITLRAAYAAEAMRLGTGCTVERWVDAKKSLVADKNCNLGMSASAGEVLQIGNGCRFQRLYAPVIGIGESENWKIRRDFKLHENWEIQKGNGACAQIRKSIRYLDERYTDERRVVPYAIITPRNLMVLEAIVVLGDIRSHKGVRLCDHCFVCGNVFAEEDVRIGTGVVVFGNIFTQGNIVVEREAVIGQPGQIHSMVARGDILLEEGVTIYGFVSCEGRGAVAERKETVAI